MKRVRHWLIRGGLILLAVLIIAAIVGAWLVRRSWPQVEGTISVPGLVSPVQVMRDQWGVPQIYAQSEHDLFFAQGYVHAQDRLWQMEINRRYGSGTLSEIIGEDTVGFDRFMRTLGLRRVAEQSWVNMDDESRLILQAYADGVNAYVASHNGRLPLEFTIMGVNPEPWTPIDSIVWGNVLSLNMGLNYYVELLRMRMIASVGAEATEKLLPISDKNTPIIVPTELNSYNGLQDISFAAFTDMNGWQNNPALSWGSNNWVVHGSRTASGKPLLANDTHLDFALPSVWYENGLHGGRFNTAGFSLPGVPLIILGHNQAIAWGITNLDPDVQDLYIEKLDDVQNPTQYEFMGEWHDLDVIQETIIVNESDPVTLNVYFTRHGPLVNDIFDLPDDEPMSLRWTLYEGSEVFTAIIQLNKATNWDEFRTSLQYWDTLSQNFVYADVEGNIGYQAAGRVPIRVPNHQGIVPVPGWTGEYEWQGFIPFDELPRLFNPPAGFVATANNKVVDDDYPYLIAYDWYYPGYRARHITDLLAANDQATVADMQNIQAETYSLPAEALRPYLLAIEPENERQAEALAYLEAWDLRFDEDSIGATIYEVWYLWIVHNTLLDVLDEELLGNYESYANKFTPMMIELMADPDHAWFDDANTPEKETRDDVLRGSLINTLDWISARRGENMNEWAWGSLHTITFVHAPFGRSGIPLLERIFNSQTIPIPGTQMSVNVAWYDEPFEVSYGTAQRMIVDMADLDNMLMVNSTGQSGHLFHTHREDMIEAWQTGQYHTMPFTESAVNTNTVSTLTLTP